MKTLRAAGRFLSVVGLGLAIAAMQSLIMGPLLRNRHTMARVANKLINKVLRIDVDLKGRVDQSRQALIVANHMSYLDAPVLGSIFRSSFIGKREIGSWPVIGAVVKLFDPILIKRRKENNSHAHFKLVKALNEGKSITFFPEATTTNGADTLRFKAGMFRILFGQAVDRDNKPLTVERPVVVQPVAIRVAEVNGRDARHNQSLRDYYAWHGDEGLLTHIWKKALMANGMRLEVTILQTLDPDDYDTPEDLANAAHKLVSDVVKPPVAA